MYQEVDPVTGKLIDSSAALYDIENDSEQIELNKEKMLEINEIIKGLL